MGNNQYAYLDKKKDTPKGANQNIQENYTLENHILSILKDGESHSRGELVELTGCHDRKIRRAIKTLRADGHMIVSNSESRGYMLSKNINEIQHCINELEKRGADLITTAEQMKAWAIYKISKGEIDVKNVV